jgi:hypothetical protein
MSNLTSTQIKNLRNKYEEDFLEECFEFFGTQMTPSHPFFTAFLTYIEMKKDQETGDESDDEPTQED